MIQFILNNQQIKTGLPPGSTVLDFVRYHKRLTGTKIGCREGDCGACTILVGDLENNRLVYRNMTSCLMPLINAQGKHIVTVEGINMDELSPVQQSLVETNGTQCGFCTIGFVMSLTGFVMSNSKKKYEDVIAAIDGNICRCTGYKSIERAAQEILAKIKDRPENETMAWLAEHRFIPGYFSGIETRLSLLKKDLDPETIGNPALENKLNVSGGTDLVVQKHHLVKKAEINNLFDRPELKQILLKDNLCFIGASVTATAFSESKAIQQIFPHLKEILKLISSTPIRNMATMGGNLGNASPIGDMSIFFLALNSDLVLFKDGSQRKIKLSEFYKGYKQLDLVPGEIIENIVFKIPDSGMHFNFEKVCKRSMLDIASVNSACLLTVSADETIVEIHLSAGGVAPFPKYLHKTSEFLKGKKFNRGVILEAIKIMQGEISPISDVRGTAEYKKLLLRQLFLAHLVKFFGMTEEIRKVLLNKPN